MDNRERLASFPGIAEHCELGHVTTVHPESDPENSLLLKFSRVYRKETQQNHGVASPSMVRRNAACRRLLCDAREPVADRAAFSRPIIRLVASPRCSAARMCSHIVVAMEHSNGKLHEVEAVASLRRQEYRGLERRALHAY